MLTDTSRLKFIIEHTLYLENDYGNWHVWELNHWGDDNRVTDYKSSHKTPEEAIDAAMEKWK